MCACVCMCASLGGGGRGEGGAFVFSSANRTAVSQIEGFECARCKDEDFMRKFAKRGAINNGHQNKLGLSPTYQLHLSLYFDNENTERIKKKVLRFCVKEAEH